MITALVILAICFGVGGYVGAFDRTSQFRQVTRFIFGREPPRLMLPADKCRRCEMDLSSIAYIPLGPGANACHPCYQTHILPELEGLVFEKARLMVVPAEKPASAAEVIRKLEEGSKGGNGGTGEVTVVYRQVCVVCGCNLIAGESNRCMKCKAYGPYPFPARTIAEDDVPTLAPDHYTYKGGHCPCGCTKKKEEKAQKERIRDRYTK